MLTMERFKQRNQDTEEQYRLIKASEVKSMKANLDTDYSRRNIELKSKYTEDSLEYNKQIQIVKEIENLKRKNKDLRQEYNRIEANYEHEQLTRQK